MFEIVLYQPEIPPNTGNIMRLCVNAPARLHLIEPLGFSLDERRLRRAGMDYRDLADVLRHRSLEDCRVSLGERRWLAFSTRGGSSLADCAFRAGDVLLFGRETAGLPEHVLAGMPAGCCVAIPQLPGSRSLNLSNAVAVALYEAWRQIAYAGAR